MKLAALADVNPATVNQVEGGVRQASPATLRKLADALDVSVSALLDGDLEEESHEREGRAAYRERKLREIREKYRPYAEALHYYCDDYGGLVRDGTAEPPNAAQFVRTLLTVGRGMGRVYRDELEDIADALGLARYAGERIVAGEPREEVEAGIDAQLFEHSEMHAAIQRYFELGESLADTVGDVEGAKAVRDTSRRLFGAAA